jgi:hypothetical protein
VRNHVFWLSPLVNSHRQVHKPKQPTPHFCSRLATWSLSGVDIFEALFTVNPHFPQTPRLYSSARTCHKRSGFPSSLSFTPSSRAHNLSSVFTPLPLFHPRRQVLSFPKPPLSLTQPKPGRYVSSQHPLLPAFLPGQQGHAPAPSRLIPSISSGKLPNKRLSHLQTITHTTHGARQSLEA